MRTRKPEALFQGKPCKYGHNGLRYKGNYACRECAIVRGNARYAAKKQELKEKAWVRRGMPLPTRVIPDFCECCGSPPNGHGPMHSDHSHVTGVWRGWLCSRCNVGVGCLGDSIAGLKQMIAYLERAGETH